MARKSTASSTLFVVLLLLAVTGEMMVGVEGRMCHSKSHKFKGQCWSDTNCANVCHSEGFPGGDCQGFRRRCFCAKPC